MHDGTWSFVWSAVCFYLYEQQASMYMMVHVHLSGQLCVFSVLCVVYYFRTSKACCQQKDFRVGFEKKKLPFLVVFSILCCAAGFSIGL